ncbi:MAG TPA: DUF6596 domain-containing protein [Candidatus Limnocylindrales bacterium]
MADGGRTSGTPSPIDPSEVGRIFREESGRSIASLIRLFGDIDVAEDAVQDAFAIALERWPVHGLPPNPGGWVTTTARNRAIDRLRRAARERELLGQASVMGPQPFDRDVPEEVGPVQDDRLRLIFTCCHPALAAEAQVALTLRLLGGLSTSEVASAFLVPEPTMEKRLVRAKHKIRAARVPYRIPEDHELPARLPPVLAVFYLIYNAGLNGRALSALCAEAIRLAAVLVELMPDEGEVAGLLALLLLIEARRAARTAPDGSLVLLADQDRSRWDRGLMAEGHAIVRACLRRNRPGPYQIQAAINAVHADAATFQETDWAQIVGLYDQLLAMTPTPVVALNRAVAVGEVAGPAAALALVEDLELDGYHPFHATRADLLWRVGRRAEAGIEFQRAAEVAPTEAEREFFRLGGRWGARSR